jgi:iron(III) transport system substrate-binding protein
MQALVLALAALFLPAPAAAKSELRVYTSIDKEYAEPLKAAFQKAHPDVSVQIFQAGSETLQAKLEAELVAKKPQADIVLASDPFWTLDLLRRGLIAGRPGHEPVETSSYSLMVLIAHRSLPADQRPRTFSDLMRPEMKGLVQLGSPLESSTMFATVASLSKKYGWAYFEKLRANKIASAGDTSTVIRKVETGEKKVGVALLENALAAAKRGSPIDVIYPADGSIPIPSVQAILKDAKNAAAAARFADFLLSEAGQKLLVAGYRYPVHAQVAPPEGAKPLAEVTKGATAWTPEMQLQVADAAKDIKKKFAALILD